MTEAMGMDAEQSLECAEILVDVAAADTEYRDLYLRRAREVLALVMPAAALRGARSERERLGRLREEVGRALAAEDWVGVRDLTAALSGRSNAGWLVRSVWWPWRRRRTSRGVRVGIGARFD